MLIIILLADTNVSGLISLYREIGAMLIGGRLSMCRTSGT